jgi:hypothetical protein
MIILTAISCCCSFLFAQTNMKFTNPEILNVLRGDYDPQVYMPAEMISDPNVISTGMLDEISPDSMKATLFSLRTFANRNTGSDTLSATKGIGAARTWVLKKFNEYSVASENRLVTGYFQFDQNVCNMGRHKNVVAVLPGRDTTDPSMILIEAHLDSRCATLCDIVCLAEGMEDNASGVALVMELARVMSKYTFDHTIVFAAMTGEEQGLVGAEALALYATQESIPIKAVLNNDVIGGIICGKTASSPGCPGLNHIDSTHVRMFSYGGFNSFHKSLARFIKLEYYEMIRNQTEVPMTINIMAAEDRTGRGGDHIPFRINGFTSMRFTSANEHGDANVEEPGYHDRQHTSDDILGVDTDGDDVIDSFFVDFNYLSRNALINGIGAAMAASGPETPLISSFGQDGSFLYIELEDPHEYGEYVIGIRTTGHDFDTLYYLSGTTEGVFQLPSSVANLFVTAASIDSMGTESLFSEEVRAIRTGVEDVPGTRDIELLQNKPNPFDESTTISFWIADPTTIKNANIVITDLSGKEIKTIGVPVTEGMNEVLFHHGYNMTGTYLYSLVIDGKLIATKKMIFAN